ncbi:cytochrome P450 [Stipitochalara longipes BDJ]|nr:cytochrome P450 [Stipitochalara longipes BDJ]
MSSLAQLLVLALLSLALYLLYQYFGRLRPLNSIPNAHFTAPFSPIWLISIRYRKRENRTVWASHKRLGPVIRLAPDEISVCTLQGIKTIYGAWDKNKWYEAFINYEVPPLVAEIHSAPHTAHKRRMANVYSKSFLQNSSDISNFNTLILTEGVLPKIATSASNGSSLDVLRLGYAYGMDVMSAYEFGSAYGTTFLNDDEALSGFLAAFTAVKNGFFWAGRLPTMTQTLQRIGVNLVPQEAMDGQAYMEDMCWKLCSRLQTAVETDSLSHKTTKPVVYSQLYSSLEKNLEKTSLSHANDLDFIRKSVASDMLDHLIAGYETSGIALAYTMYELCMHPAFQTALRAELRSLSPPLTYPLGSEASAFSASHPPSTLPRILDSLPLLNAALYETLRLYPPGAAGQPRVVPRGGAVLCGFPLPEGVVAHAAPYSVHRNEDVFERAEEWLPERWMGDKKKEVKDWFWAFGSGRTGCIGREFAVQEMLVLLAAVYTNFSSHIVDADGIEPIDEFIAGPKAGKLILRFEKFE